jgi:uncharacterized protein YqeY
MPDQQQIDADLKTAMLNKNSGAVSVLRMLKSELKNSEIAQGALLTDKEVETVIRKEAKKRRESATMYRTGDNVQQAGIEEAEAEFLERYLPAQISEEEVSSYLKEITASSPAAMPSEKGHLIRKTLEHFNGEADGKMVSGLVNALFSESAD